MSSVEFKLDDNSNANRTQLVEKIVNEVKSRGIFDQFRRECLTEIDRRPAFQLLQQKVISNVNHFLDELKWRPDLNKNQLRETLRQNIIRSNFFDNGIEKLVNQVVDTKVEELFRPKIDELIKKLFGIEDEPIMTQEISDESIKMNSDKEIDNLPESINNEKIENELLSKTESVMEITMPDPESEHEPEPLPPGEEEDYFAKPAEANIEISEQVDSFEEETVFEDINEISESIEIPEQPTVQDTNSDKNNTIFDQLIESNSIKTPPLMSPLQSHTPPIEDVVKSEEAVISLTSTIINNEPSIDEKIPEVESNEQNITIDSEITETTVNDDINSNITDVDTSNIINIIEEEKVVENKVEDKKVESTETTEKTDNNNRHKSSSGGSSSSKHRHHHSSSKSESNHHRHHHHHHSSSKSSSGHHHSRHSHGHHSSSSSRSSEKHSSVAKHNKRSLSSSSSTCSSTNHNKRHHSSSHHHSHHGHRDDHKHEYKKHHSSSDKKSYNDPKVEPLKQETAVSSKSSKSDEKFKNVNNIITTSENTVNNDKKTESIKNIDKEVSNLEKEKQLKKEEIIKQMKEKLERSKEKIKLEMERENSRKLDEKQKKITEKQERKKEKEKEKLKVKKKKRERGEVKNKKSTKLLAMPAYIDTMAVENELETIPTPQTITPKIQRIRKPNMKYCSDEFTSEYFLPHEQNDKILNDINTMKRKRELESQELVMKKKVMKEKLQLQMPIQQPQLTNGPDEDIGEAIEDIAAAVAEVTAHRQYNNNNNNNNNNNQSQLLYSTNAISYNMFPQGPNTMLHGQLVQNQQNSSVTQLLPSQQITGIPILNMPQQQSITMITVPSSLPQSLNQDFVQQPIPQSQQTTMQQFHQQPTIIQPFTPMPPHCMPQMILSSTNIAPMIQTMPQQQQQPILLTPQQQQIPLSTHDLSPIIQQDLPHDLQSIIPQELSLIGMHEVSSLIEEELGTRLEEQSQIENQEESLLDFNNVDNTIESEKDVSLEDEKQIDTIAESIMEEKEHLSDDDDESLQSLRKSLKNSKKSSPKSLRITEPERELESTVSVESVVPVKKKRGRKRKVPLVEDDNKKIQNVTNVEIAVVRKSKRGRKKKIIPLIDLAIDDKIEDNDEINSDDESLENIRKSLKKREKCETGDEKDECDEQNKVITNSDNECGNKDDEGDGLNKTEEENDNDSDVILIEDVVNERTLIGSKRSEKAQRYPTLNEEDIVSYVNYRPPRNKKVQRYTNDDLYKPRVSYSNTRSRSKSKTKRKSEVKSIEQNNKNNS